MGPAGLRVDARRGLSLPLLLLPPPLLLLLLLLPPAAPGVTCPPPTAIEHADIRVRSHRQGSRERYACYSGFKRRAGTSSLTECVYNETTGTARWTRPTLQCIHVPRYDATRVNRLLSAAAPFLVLCGLGLLCALCWWRRRGSGPRTVATESPEELPMTGPLHGAEEEPGSRPP
ncbi:interleukin-15 receptor subunit alpha isoform X2 [Sorex araneus]|uniref:interleukin-15 receptor subunit alpha isoform X2 n=1 Tax=Sorex araneus TaxID=42254 RepID=UPI002433A6E6|nr:interleukin-15 receptor subunit alpha isoform X2 [Sorex araneus]